MTHKTSAIYQNFKYNKKLSNQQMFTYLLTCTDTNIGNTNLQRHTGNCTEYWLYYETSGIFFTDSHPTFLHIHLLEFVVITKGDGSHSFPLSELVCLNNKGFFCVFNTKLEHML